MGLSFVARFFKPNTRKQFKEANQELVKQIECTFSKQDAADFSKAFSSKISLGRPLTVGSVRAFVNDLIVKHPEKLKLVPGLNLTDQDSVTQQDSATQYMINSMIAMIPEIVENSGTVAAVKFYQEFSSRLSWGSPLTATRLNAFIHNLPVKLETDLPGSASLMLLEDNTKYDICLNKDITNIFERYFGKDVENRFSNFLKENYANTPLTSEKIKNFVANIQAKNTCPAGKEVENFFKKQLAEIFNYAPDSQTEKDHNPHEWNGGSVTKDDPKIADVFFTDMNRGSYFLQPKPGELENLYVHPVDSKQEDNNKKAAAQKLVDFVGNRDQAFEISKVINQSGLCHPFLTMLTKSEVTPFKLPLEEKNGLFPDDKPKLSFTLSKNDSNQTVISFESKSNPIFFKQIDKAQKLPDENFIPLDENSFVNYSYDVTCIFDNNNKLTMVPSNIKYDVNMKAGFNKTAYQMMC
jgi:hypothetical protein